MSEDKQSEPRPIPTPGCGCDACEQAAQDDAPPDQIAFKSGKKKAGDLSGLKGSKDGTKTSSSFT